MRRDHYFCINLDVQLSNVKISNQVKTSTKTPEFSSHGVVVANTSRKIPNPRALASSNNPTSISLAIGLPHTEPSVFSLKKPMRGSYQLMGMLSWWALISLIGKEKKRSIFFVVIFNILIYNEFKLNSKANTIYILVV